MRLLAHALRAMGCCVVHGPIALSHTRHRRARRCCVPTLFVCLVAGVFAVPPRLPLQLCVGEDRECAFHKDSNKCEFPGDAAKRAAEEEKAKGLSLVAELNKKAEQMKNDIAEMADESTKLGTPDPPNIPTLYADVKASVSEPARVYESCLPLPAFERPISCRT